MTEKKLRIGTRGSDLALYQACYLKECLSNHHPKIECEIVEIQTEGDRIQDRPLSAMEGKDFFVKEIDEALLNNQVDVAVHSYKDLASDRPEGVELACVLQREDPRDIIFFNLDPQKTKTIRVGTSSPRRQVFLERKLASFIPGDWNVECRTLRGNVPSRLRKFVESQDGINAICLASAGLKRLGLYKTAFLQQLKGLIETQKFVLLPLQAFPTTAAQGAIAVECRADDDRTKGLLLACHSEQTALRCKQERQRMQDFGGGCHQKFGVSSSKSRVWIEGFVENDFEWIRRKYSDKGSLVQDIDFSSSALDYHGAFVSSSLVSKGESVLLSKEQEQKLEEAEAWFVAHRNGWTEQMQRLYERNPSKIIFVSGEKTWDFLVEKGVWVNGSSERAGTKLFLENWRPFITKVVKITHQDAVEDPTWQVATYKMILVESTKEIQEKIAQKKRFFWTSSFHYDAVKDFLPPEAEHACGNGLTYEKLKPVIPRLKSFDSPQDWLEWIFYY